MYFLLDFTQRELQSTLRFSWLLAGINPAVCEFLLLPSLLCLLSGHLDLPLYGLSLFFRTPLFPADLLCKITGNLLPFSAFVTLQEPLSKVHWFRFFFFFFSLPENHCICVFRRQSKQAVKLEYQKVGF